jgi:hypothetical protein
VLDEVLMLANLINWMGAGLGGGSAVSVEQGALVYLMVSLLGPLSWMLVVEICRRAQKSQRGSRNPLAHCAVARLALPVARLKKPGSPERWVETRPEED